MREGPEHRGSAGDASALYARAQRGETSAWGPLESASLPAVAARVRRLFGALAPWEADEVASDAFVLLFERSPGIPSWPEARAFLGRAAELLALNRARKGRRSARDPKGLGASRAGGRAYARRERENLPTGALDRGADRDVPVRARRAADPASVELADPRSSWAFEEVDAGDLLEALEARSSSEDREILLSLVAGKPAKRDLLGRLGISSATLGRRVLRLRRRALRAFGLRSRRKGS